MKRVIVAAAVLAAVTGTAMAQMVPMVRQGLVPYVAPVLEKICLPVAGGAALEAGIAAAKSQGFAVTAAHGKLATLQKERLVINLGPGNCLLTLTPAGSATFPHVDHELSGWLPRLGRYWAGDIEADAAGLQSRKFRAGGHTVLVWEMVDEDVREVNVNIGK
jgi:hypothetical protein